MKALVWGVALVVLGVGCNDEGISTTPAGSPQELVTRTDIVSDQPGAAVTDGTLVNAWGLAFNPLGFAWVSSTESGISEVYDSGGNHAIPSVVIPLPPGMPAPSAPTGQAFNGDNSVFMGDTFIFVTEEGTIAGWQQPNGALAVMRVDNSAAGASYKGVAIGTSSAGQARLYAANFHAGRVDTYDAGYNNVGSIFADPQLPQGFAPFNVAVVQGVVLVAYALQDQDAADDVKGLGNGYVNLFDGDGNLMARLLSAGELNSPWGMTLAPSSFAAAPNRLLVGNFGDGLTHIYNLDLNARTASLAGMLRDSAGAPLAIDGLWALEFGNGAGGFASNQLYFTAGPQDETHGVFGRLQATGTGNVGTPPVNNTNGGSGGGTTGSGGYVNP